jgi:hypothetical protein
MKFNDLSKSGMRVITMLGLILSVAVVITACTQSASWQEEVLLSDGSLLIVSRAQSSGSLFKPAKGAPLSKQSFAFIHPVSGQTVKWKTEYEAGTSLQPLAIDIVKGVVYLATTPVGSFAFKQWGQPAPPYVFFKYADNLWQRVSLPAVPVEIKGANIVIDTRTEEQRLKAHSKPVSADEIKTINLATVKPGMEYLSVFVRSVSEPATVTPTQTDVAIAKPGESSVSVSAAK